ncbi:MAG: carbamoyltransferase HypF [Planctomycetota bacterium]
MQVTGTVQGVGFRPFVYRLAAELGLAGSVRNAGGGVEIDAQGAPRALDEFMRRLRDDAPPLARIRALTADDAEPTAADTFRIEMTADAGELDVDAARDIATCGDCLAEMRDPSNRRHRHPFINCTDCGPRYTLIEKLPYDRPNTSMRAFPMCPACRAEYEDPADRRFHAQPVCCHDCGPTLELLDADGRPVDADDPLGAVADVLAAGGIAAIKGIGGFHLACDATSRDAVRRLRRRKHREEKPLAILARDLDAARAIAELRPAEQALLESPERPITLLAKRPVALIADAVDPRSRFHGIMLPYTPIHHLLAERLPYLVMTSGNRTEEPIARTNDEAVQKLAGIADAFLVHDRAILTRNDDSVVREVAGDVVILRRSRGYAPEPIAVGADVDGILATGPMLKNCIAVGRGELCYVSQHIGDLANAATYRSLEETTEKLAGMVGVEPRLVACDRHPDYPSTRFAESLGLPLVRVPHHHAHVAACMAEHGLTGRVIGVAFDGTGHGDDGHTWGSEVLIADRAGSERFAHLAYMRMPGGDAAVSYPGRMALGALFPRVGADARRAVPWMDESEAAAVLELLDRGVNTPLTCGMGRLFDATAAILDVCRRTTYEGQPAMELEGVADPRAEGSYRVEIAEADGVLQVDGAAVLAAVCEDRDAGVPVPAIAGRFHNTIVDVLVQCVVAAARRTGLDRVCLSGGCFQNAILVERSVARLEARGLSVFRHRLVPPSDGCVALGQMTIAAATRG